MGALGKNLLRLFFSAALFFSRLVSALSHHSLLHNARFARLDEFSNLLKPSSQHTETSLLLGVGRFGHVLRVPPLSTRRELGNLLIVAPTRGGKGLLAVSQLLTWKHSVVVNDIKGDLFTQTAGFRSTLGKVFVLDPTGSSHRFDPLLNKYTEAEFLSSATQLLFEDEEGEGTVFTQRATAMLAQLFLAARLEKTSPLPYVRRMIRQDLISTAERLNTLSPELSTQFLYAQYDNLDSENKFLVSAWDTLVTRLKLLLTEDTTRCFNGSDFTACDLITSDQPMTVYLRWAERDLLALAPLVKLLWGSLIDELITTYDRAGGKNCNPVLLLLDEAGRTAIPSLSDHATTVVGRGISLWIAIQSLSQLDAIYGKSRATVLRDNMESQIYYRPSNQETAEYLERCLSRRSDYAHSQTVREGNHTSEGRSEQGVPLLTALAIKQLKDEDIIGFHRRLPPFRARRMDWRQFPLLAKRRCIPPPRLSSLPLLENQVSHTLWQKPQVLSYIDPDKLY